MASQISEEVKRQGLEKYVFELETDGLTIVPPEVTGIEPAFVDHCVQALLKRFTELTGCPITLEDGPLGELEWPGGRYFGAEQGAPTQMLLNQLLRLDRGFRDLVVHPVADALIDHMMGRVEASLGMGGSARRLSSTQSFVKWEGDSGFGEGLGLHSDQGAFGLGVFAGPKPWGTTALVANATWCLTDYTKRDGALAYVPGSHRFHKEPIWPQDAAGAVPAEAPRGSLIVWHGTTWHGAFPKLTRGLRLNAVSYYRHASFHQQENLRVTMRDEPWDDCGNPELMRELLGFDDPFPYIDNTGGIPKLREPGNSDDKANG